MHEKRALIIFWTSLCITRLFLIVFLYVAQVGLFPDEAHYWTWSKLLDVGYYSKPPGIAWQIFLGTSLCGDTELGIRLVAFMLPIISALILTKIVFILTKDREASYLASTAFILSPLGFSAAFCATTDSPMILFYLLAIYAYITIERPYLRYCICGILIGMGALFKWVIYTLFIAFFKLKELPAFCLGILISLIGIIPSLYWNIHHDFVTFRHISALIDGSHHPSFPNPLLFSIATLFLLSPGFFILGLPGITYKKARPLLIAALTVFLSIFALSCFKKVQVNWATSAGVLFFAFLGVSLHLHPKWGKKPYTIACLVAILLQGISFASPFFNKAATTICPFKQAIGIEQLSRGLDEAGYNKDLHFLFSSNYQTASLLWFYGKGQKRSYFLNIDHLRQNQFCFLPDLNQDCLGKDGIYVRIVKANEYKSLPKITDSIQTRLLPYFASLDPPSLFPIKNCKHHTISYLIIIPCHRYQNNPVSPNVKY
jgi:hypothetical protein